MPINFCYSPPGEKTPLGPQPEPAILSAMARRGGSVPGPGLGGRGNEVPCPVPLVSLRFLSKSGNNGKEALAIALQLAVSYAGYER